MPINIYIFSPRPKLDQTDALVNEIDLLYKDTEYKKIFIYPKMGLARIIPYQWWGIFWAFFNQASLHNKETIHHLYVNRLCYFSFLRGVDTPVYLSLNTSLKNQQPNSDKLGRYKNIFVQSKADAQILSKMGLRNSSALTPAFPDFNIVSSYLDPSDRLRVLSASGPWKKTQIESKGFILLVEAMKEEDLMELTIVLRNYFLKEINALVTSYGLQNKTEIVDGKIEIQKYLDQSHCTILVVNNPLEIKAYPHSLLESLQAHKPVIVSDNIAIADFVLKYEAGIVVKSFTSAAINKAIKDLKNDYSNYVENTKKIPWEKYNHKMRKEEVFTSYGQASVE